MKIKYSKVIKKDLDIKWIIKLVKQFYNNRENLNLEIEIDNEEHYIKLDSNQEFEDWVLSYIDLNEWLWTRKERSLEDIIVIINFNFNKLW
jgi:hypothetical protein